MKHLLFGASIAAFLAFAALAAVAPVKADPLGLAVAQTRLVNGESPRLSDTFQVSVPLGFRDRVRQLPPHLEERCRPLRDRRGGRRTAALPGWQRAE